MVGSCVLNDFQQAQAPALYSSPAQEQAAIPGRAEKHSARRREVSVGIQVFGDADGVLEYRGLDILPGIDIDAAH